MDRIGWWLAAAFLSLSAPAFAQGGEEKGFDNKSVIALDQAGLGDNTIVAKINSSACGYDVTTNGLITLKQAGVADDVIAAMVARCGDSPRPQATGLATADPLSAHVPGIYVLQDWLAAPQMQLMRPSKASGIKVTGNGSILLTYVGRLVLPDEQSRIGIKTHRPVFYFYFVAGDRKVSGFGTPNSVAAQSPDEFSLVHFKVKKNEREVGVGKLSAYSSQRGIDPKEAIRFDASEIVGSAFKVRSERDLEPGEYAFVLTGANGTARVYDFTIL